MKIKKLSMLLLFVLFASSINMIKAHYGPRGLLGGTIVCGTHFDGNVAVGTESGGVFISTNNQLNGWRVRNVGLKSGKTKALFHNGTNLFVATADSGIFIFNGSAGGNDLFWNPRNNGIQGLPLISLGGIDNVLFAGTQGAGLFRSDDAGLNWSEVNSPFFENKTISAIQRVGSRILAASQDVGIYYSDDNGVTWAAYEDVNMMNLIGVSSITYNQDLDQLLVYSNSGLRVVLNASVTTNPEFIDVNENLPSNIQIRNVANNNTAWYIATDNGVYFTAMGAVVNWTVINNGLPNTNTNVVVALSETIVVGTHKSGVFKSNVNEIAWLNNNAGTHGISNISTNSVAGKGDSTVVTATEYGIVVSNNLGLDPLFRNNGLVDSLNVNDVEFAGDYLIAATQNAGVFWSTDLGLNWQQINTGISESNIKRIYYSNEQKFVISASGKIYISELSATTWQEYNNGISSNHSVTSLAFYGELLYAGTIGGGVYKKQRNESTWTQFNTGLSVLNVTAVAVSAGQLFAGTDGAGIFVSDFDNANWAATNPIFIEHFNDVSINPNHIQYMTAFAGYLIASYRGGVVATVNGGESWIRGGHQFHLPSFSSIQKISFINSRINVATEHNSMMSNSLAEFALIDTILTVSAQTVLAPADGKRSFHSITSNIKWQITSSHPWVKVSADSGFRNMNIYLDIEANNGISRTATVTLTGGSITQTITVSQEGTVSVMEPDLENTIQVWPNPSNGQLNVTFDNPSDIKSLRLFDVTGKQVRNVVFENQPILTFDTKLPSGIYFLNIETRERVVTKKIVFN
jgi:hypothetical protein